MTAVGLLAVAAGAALSGYWTWRRATARMRYRSANPTIRPSHVAPQDYDAWVVARRKRSRLIKTIAAAAAGAAIAWLLFTMIESGVQRR